MTPTITQMQTWFDEFNKQVFNDTLPKVKISFNNTRRMLGQFYWGNGRGIGIKISLFWDRTDDQYRNCLLHEMCHLYCYHQGWIREGHGSRWKNIANYAYRKTGLLIQRCEDIKGWVPSGTANQEKLEVVKAKRLAPSIILDLDYGDYHFIVKTTKKVLQSNDSTDWNCKVKTSAKSYRVVLSDAPLFSHYQTSRSIHRGYRYNTKEYEKSVKDNLDKGIAVENLGELFRGKFDCLGIR